MQQTYFDMRNLNTGRYKLNRKQLACKQKKIVAQFRIVFYCVKIDFTADKKPRKISKDMT